MANVKKVAPVLDKSIQDKLDSFTSTAAKVRFLSAEGHSRGDISRILDIRYQWVRNVLETPLKKS